MSSEHTATMTQYKLQFLKIYIKEISKKEISQLIYKIASNNFQQNGLAYSIQKSNSSNV